MGIFENTIMIVLIGSPIIFLVIGYVCYLKFSNAIEEKKLVIKNNKEYLAQINEKLTQDFSILKDIKKEQKKLDEEQKDWAEKIRELNEKTKEINLLESRCLAEQDKLNRQRNELEQDLNKKEAILKEIKEINDHFAKSYVSGKKWLINLIIEYNKAKHENIESYLLSKKNPAPKAQKIVQQLKFERKEIERKFLTVKAELEALKEYYPVIEEYADEILQEAEEQIPDESEIRSQKDPAKAFLTDSEYKRLTDAEKNQLALDRYKTRKHSKWELGKIYELYLGWMYTEQNYVVEHTGIRDKLKDKGRDLICRDIGDIGETLIIQAKCWSKDKTIHEKHIFQLYGSVVEYRLQHPGGKVKGLFITTTKLSDFARECARELGIEVKEYFELKKDFPMIKCNISSTGEKIYHLPFDQQYNKVVIDKPGEFLAKTVSEAEEKGFRRSYRWGGMA